MLADPAWYDKISGKIDESIVGFNPEMPNGPASKSSRATRRPCPYRNPTRNWKRSSGKLIAYIGDDPDREGLKETPKRVLKAMREQFRGYDQDLTNI
ncbi:MAG: GTP cyclohydrolase I [Polyangiales bacterium]